MPVTACRVVFMRLERGKVSRGPERVVPVLDGLKLVQAVRALAEGGPVA